jgi:hypothetical protein
VKETTKYFAGYWLLSYFGILGALDTYFPTAMVLAFLIFSTIVAITDICMIKKIKTSTRLISFASCVVIITVSIITMYIEWNPRVIDNPTGNIAYGMQGRYYIPLSLFVILPFSNGLLTKFKFKNQLILLEEKTMKLVSSCYLVLTALLLLTRYWI